MELESYIKARYHLFYDIQALKTSAVGELAEFRDITKF